MTPTDIRLAMRANGYDPLPANGKKPYLLEWQTKINLSREEIASWEIEYPQCRNTGNNATNVGGIDGDFTDPEVAKALRLEIADWFASQDKKFLCRVGNAPKFLIPFASGISFTKMERWFKAPNGEYHHFEILKTGQQWIAFGFNPDAQRDYEWVSELNPTNIRSDELPLLDEKGARELLDYLSDFLNQQFEYVKTDPPAKPKGNGHSEPFTIDKDADIEELLTSIPLHGFNAVHRHVIPRLLWRAWHPGEIVDYVTQHTLQRAQVLNTEWKDKTALQRRIILGRVKSSLKNLFTNKYDHTSGELPKWLAQEFHEQWVNVLARQLRPELHYDGNDWAVHAVTPPGNDNSAGAGSTSSGPSEPPPAISLTVNEWRQRKLAPADRLMGDWLTTTSRILLSADTGMGKTSLAMALNAHSGAGIDFLHWRAHRRARLLYIDGEMSRQLLQRRIMEAVDRLGVDPEGALFLSKEDVENFPPLNTPGGIAFLLKYVNGVGGIDAITFDNIMALLVGDQKDEITWNAILPLVSELTKRCIGQIWINHTGHDASRSYGSKTKEWRMDTTIHLTEAKRADTDLSFQVEFRKARDRTPENRADFADVTVALVGDQWTCSAAPVGQVPPKTGSADAKALEILRELIASDQAVLFRGYRAVKIETWRALSIRRGLCDTNNPKSRQSVFDRSKRRLVSTNMVYCDGELAWPA